MTAPMHLPTKSIAERATDAMWLMPLLLVMLCEGLSIAIEPSKPLAVPSAGPGEWGANPQLALQAVLADNQKLMQAVQDLSASRTDWIGYAVGGVGVLIGLVKVFNGPAGVLAESLWAMLAPKFVKDSEKKREVMADGFLQVAEIMRSFPASTPLSHVLDKLDRRLPEAVKTAYREWEANEAGDRPDARSAAPVVRQPLVTGT